jgi:hypothetical protein
LAVRSLVFDGSGRTWVGGSLALRSQVGCGAPYDNLTDYVVRNMGYVEVGARGPSLHVRLRPSVVQPMALAAALYWVADRRASRVLVSWLGPDGWSHEVSATRSEATQRLTDLALTMERVTSDEFQFQQRDLEGLPAQLKALLEQWRAHPTFDRERLAQAMEGEAQGRYILVKHIPSASRPELLVEECGRGLMYNDAFRAHAVGERFEDQPNYHYGRRAAEAYLHVASSGVPRFEEVTATMFWPQRGRIRHNYARLILPYSQDDGSSLLLCASVLGSTIELGVKGLREVR